MFIHTLIYLFIRSSIYLLTYLSIYLSIYLLIFSLIYSLIYLITHSFIYAFIYLFIFFIYLFIYLQIGGNSHALICLYICFSFAILLIHTDIEFLTIQSFLFFNQVSTDFLALQEERTEDWGGLVITKDPYLHPLPLHSQTLE